MQKNKKTANIRIRGANEGALRGVDVDLELGTLICLIGRSGSGHRDLAVRVLYGESRSRYMRVLSPFEREGQIGAFRVAVDEVSGLPPAICYQERDSIPPGTVAAFLALDGHLARLVLQHGEIICPHCGAPCRAYAADEVESEVLRRFGEGRCLVLAPLAISADSAGDLVLAELRRAGFLRVRINQKLYRLVGELPELKGNDYEFAGWRQRQSSLSRSRAFGAGYIAGHGALCERRRRFAAFKPATHLC
jgi:excinuclease ABC subunit A